MIGLLIAGIGAMALVLALVFGIGEYALNAAIKRRENRTGKRIVERR